MTKNAGTIDRIIRIVVAALFVYLAFAVVGATSVWGIILLILAVVFLFTSLSGFCPLYTLIGVNTNKKTD